MDEVFEDNFLLTLGLNYRNEPEVLNLILRVKNPECQEIERHSWNDLLGLEIKYKNDPDVLKLIKKVASFDLFGPTPTVRDDECSEML